MVAGIRASTRTAHARASTGVCLQLDLQNEHHRIAGVARHTTHRRPRCAGGQLGTWDTATSSALVSPE
jgi:hypothetical protein